MAHYTPTLLFQEKNFPALGTATGFISHFFHTAGLVCAHRQHEYKNDGGYANNG